MTTGIDDWPEAHFMGTSFRSAFPERHIYAPKLSNWRTTYNRFNTAKLPKPRALDLAFPGGTLSQPTKLMVDPHLAGAGQQAQVRYVRRRGSCTGEPSGAQRRDEEADEAGGSSEGTVYTTQGGL